MLAVVVMVVWVVALQTEFMAIFGIPTMRVAAEAAMSLLLRGNGGGLIRIVAQTINLDGLILANGAGGGTADAGGGSGGGIRIDVGTLAGTGQIRANGQDGKPRVNIGGGGGGGGRVANLLSNYNGIRSHKDQRLWWARERRIA